MKENCKKYLVEFTGAFFLVLTIACTGLLGGSGVIAPLAIASVLMVMVYAGGHVSGGHYNPAVSLAASIRGALKWSQFVPYSISQILGGLFAVLIFKTMAQGMILPASALAYDTKALFIAELLFTFALCWVVLQTATTKNTEGNSYFGLAIGFTVLVGAFSVGGLLCAGAFNPAVAISLGTLNLIDLDLIIMTIVANFVGGALAAGIFKLTNTEV